MWPTLSTASVDIKIIESTINRYGIIRTVNSYWLNKQYVATIKTYDFSNFVWILSFINCKYWCKPQKYIYYHLILATYT